jgi:hypothetical protein
MEFKLRTGLTAGAVFPNSVAQAGVDDLFTPSEDQPVENKGGESRNPDAVRGAARLPSEQASGDIGWGCGQRTGLMVATRCASSGRFTEIGGIHLRSLFRVANGFLLGRRGRLDLRDQFHAGYESEAAFNRAFKRHFGLPPAAWRKKAASPRVDAESPTPALLLIDADSGPQGSPR